MNVSMSDSSKVTPLEVMRRMLVEGFGGGNTAVVDELCSPDLVDHQFGLAGSGEQARDNVRAAMRDVHAAFPDLRFTIEDSVADGDRIWVRARGRGTATGPYFGPPSGRPVDFTVIDVARIQHGQIVEHWGVPDRLAVLAQTGVLDRLTGVSGTTVPQARVQ
jgi:predicted ester cyclase